ncbi:MAG: NAD(P)H-dependent oxidoreductase [Ruminococcaceae bacterium]|nr:NAD(P)H-dependent oxidoreductase [Oscillospiraceae bacterium]
MNLLVINGSPRTLGNCDRLLSALLSEFPRDCNVKRFDAFSLNPAACNACGYCKASEGCSKKDLEEFLGYYNESDAVIIATPVYNYTVPAPMKALLDRFQRFYEAKNRRGEEHAFSRPKNAVLIVTAGCDGRVGFEIIKKQLEGAFENMDTTLVASMLVNSTDTKPLSDFDLQKAKDLRTYF